MKAIRRKQARRFSDVRITVEATLRQMEERERGIVPALADHQDAARAVLPAARDGGRCDLATLSVVASARVALVTRDRIALA